MICSAKSKRTGNPCQAPAMKNGKCYHHGGKTPSGAASPHFKTGRYSKHLPTRMMADYKASLEDPELLNLRSEIAITDARINDLLKRVHSGESGDMWKRLGDTYELFRGSHGSATLAAQYLNELGSLIKRGNSDAAIWRELNSNLEQRRRLADSEAKRMKDMHQMFTAEQGMMLVSSIISILKDNVTDRKTLDAISQSITALVDRQDAGINR